MLRGKAAFLSILLAELIDQKIVELSRIWQIDGL
jgi:hypothetical protein